MSKSHDFVAPSWGEFGSAADDVAKIAFDRTIAYRRRLRDTTVAEVSLSKDAPAASEPDPADVPSEDGTSTSVGLGGKVWYESVDSKLRVQGHAVVAPNTHRPFWLSLDALAALSKEKIGWSGRAAGNNDSGLLGVLYRHPRRSVTLHHEHPWRISPNLRPETVLTASMGKPLIYALGAAAASLTMGGELRVRTGGGMARDVVFDGGLEVAEPHWAVTLKTEHNRSLLSLSSFLHFRNKASTQVSLRLERAIAAAAFPNEKTDQDAGLLSGATGAVSHDLNPYSTVKLQLRPFQSTAAASLLLRATTPLEPVQSSVSASVALRQQFLVPQQLGISCILGDF